MTHTAFSISQDYKLGRGDIVKLGRIKFNVKDYRTRYAAGQASSSKKDIVSGAGSGAAAEGSAPEGLAAIAN